jgi:serine/threonine protein kinase
VSRAAQLPDDVPGVASDRFHVRRRMGAGWGGVVFEAYDRAQNARVALKMLHQVAPDALVRFKNEFRSLQDLHHPNLVTLGELHENGGRWFFTMEFVDGSSFLDWVRPRRAQQSETDLPTAAVRDDGAPTEDILGEPTAPTPNTGDPLAPAPRHLDEQRLRVSLRQLAEGLACVHSAGKVHRDIKPSNVLVTHSGRVVILDFGLVLDFADPDRLTEADHFVGTVDYVAPEQTLPGRLGPAADWYSVGVMLFQALTGRLPFLGSRMNVLNDKRSREAPAPSSIVPWVASDLDLLCVDLMRRDPAARPGDADMLRRLTITTARPRPPRPPARRPVGSAPFVGREAELGELVRAYEDSRNGTTLMACVFGQSGVGKSALLRHFADQMASQRSAVVLAGRCYERELVPYKAVDGLIDQLGRFLSGLDRAEVEALLPIRAHLLGQIFPVLRRVDAIANARPAPSAATDPRELRSQGFAALRELLSRLCERRPVLIVIDDLQWTDADSVALLREVLRPPHGPPLLFCATLRGPAEGAPDFDPTVLGVDVRRIVLTPLTSADARRLTGLLLGAESGSDVDAIAKESGGYPLFIDELVRHASTGRIPASGRVDLEEALWSRIVEQPPIARSLMELVAVAGRPLSMEAAAAAVALDASEVTRYAAALRSANLIRLTGARLADGIEPYHDRIRSAVLRNLDPKARRIWHGRLALALESSDEFEALLSHWRGAERPERAAMYAVRAAEHAAGALAFDRAAQLYRAALDLGPPEGMEPGTVLARLGDALANAGRAAEAAQAYLSASGSLPTEALDLRRRAGNQLLLSGRIDEGLAVMGEILAAVGMRVPRSPLAAVVSLIFRRTQLALRGLRTRIRPASEIAPAVLQRIDLCHSLTTGLYLDPIRGLHFQTRHLLLALAAGEAYRVSRALSSELVLLASRGERGRRRLERVADMAASLAARVDTPISMANVLACKGFVEFLCGRWRNARELCERSHRMYRDQCTGVTWEALTTELITLRAKYYLGEISDLCGQLDRLRHIASEHGDLYALTQLCTGTLLIDCLARDDVDAARAMAERAMRNWSQVGTHVQHYSDAGGRASIDLYAGDPTAAQARWGEQWEAFRKALLLRVQFLRVEAYDRHGRIALGAARAQPKRQSERKRLLTVARSAASRLSRERAPWADALAALLQAGVADVAGRTEQAVTLLERAADRARLADMALHVRAAERRLGALIGGESGRARREAADAWMTEQRILSPERMTALLLP